MPPIVPKPASPVDDTPRVRGRLAAAATLLLVGIAVTVIRTGSAEGDRLVSSLGQALTVAGFVGLVWMLHRFGRLGPEPPDARSDEDAAEA